MKQVPELLFREEFTNEVLRRDNHKCVICGGPAKDAHHIMEKKLFTNGGYFLDNGASLCRKHHLLSEQTIISAQKLRNIIGIKNIILPDHFYPDQEYDKWGNILLSDNKRSPGELFFNENVQKVLKEGNILDLFDKRFKYPRTYHLDWSPGVTKDDRVMDDDSYFHQKIVYVTEKMDGECTSMYSDYIHARSIDGKNHETRDWIKNFHSTFAHDIPEGYRICAENVYAKHSIEYRVSTYCYGFSMWKYDTCLSVDETLEWFELLGITSVPVIYYGLYDRELITKLTKNIIDDYDTHEGFVIRVAQEFKMKDFRCSVGKWVRENHVQTSEHWINRKIEPNILIKEDC